MNTADYLVEVLIEHGVTDVFGYAGGCIVPFMDALKDRDEIEVHVCYNEQGCAFAANGYARVTGKLGVYFTTSGPGAVNAIGGLADAWFDSVPMLAICGNVSTSEMKGESGIRQKGFQEMDIVSMVDGITKSAIVINDTQNLREDITELINLANDKRKGGVLIDFPYDIQKATIACR